MDIHIERLEQLNRVMRGVDPGSLRMASWCGCAIGQARHDQYFAEHFNRDFEKNLSKHPMSFVADFFGIDHEQACQLFLSSGYHDLGREATPSDVVARIEVLLLAKRAAEPVVEETREFAEVL